MSGLDKAKQLSLIDSGINNIWTLSLPNHLESLNLHGNYIRHISNLSHLTRLVHLDLSSNQISNIDGLEKLCLLKTLNLSCNLITAVDGLSGLRSLERLNLSYNQIEDVSGLSDLSGPSNHLSYIALHGNKLRSVCHLIQAMKNISSLHHLVLSQDGSGNPLCHDQGYRQELWSNLKQLETINDMDKSGKLSKAMDSLSNIPGLESYLDFLLSSDKEQTPEDSNPALLITPKIDAVMEQFKQRYLDTSSSTGQSALYSSNVSSPISDNGQHTENMRKILADKGIASSSHSPTRLRNRSKTRKESSGDDSEPVRDGRDRRKSNKKQPQQSKDLNLQGKQTGAIKSAMSKTGSGRDRTSSRTKETLSHSASKKQQASPKSIRFSDGGDAPGAASTRTKLRSSTESDGDRKGRNEAEAVYKDLLSTLETERERRWKAEQAARRLADTLKEAHTKGQETETMKNSAVEATVQLKHAVLNEHETNQTLNLEIKKLQSEVRELKDHLSDAQRSEKRSREALKAAEETLARKEADDMAERVHQNKKLQEAQQRASAMTREAEMLRHSLDTTKAKLQQLQETLASREQQHREDLSSRYKLNSPELQEVLNDKVKKVEQSFQADLVKQQEKVEQLSKQYSELEDEFRYALQVEETRFREIKTEFEHVSAENLENQQLLLAAQRKDESSTSMMAELTSLVKEQKGRISELAKSKQEQTISYKERIAELEDSLQDARKQISQLEILRQSKSKLQATVQAQESVIEGLKAERKLWGQELAQQGASLSQDRGRLEAKIETLNMEILSLKKQLEREADTVKIKTKMVEDQTETIRKLKEAIVERDETIKATREENVSVQRSLEDQLTELKSALDETRDLLDRSSARKDELKQQVSDLQQELKDSKENHSTLSARWKEKSELIGRLEQQVTQMKNNWTQKETQLSAERNMALQQAKQAVDKLKTVDSAFRQQLDVKEAAFQKKITQLELEKEQEVELANRKVALVEEEMRDMLREHEANKKAMEDKLKKFTQALGDLQSGLS